VTIENVAARAVQVTEFERMLKMLEEAGRQLEQTGGLTGELIEKLKATPFGAEESPAGTVVKIAKFLEGAKKFPSIEVAYRAESQMREQTARLKKEAASIRSATDVLRAERDRLQAQYDLMLQNKQRLQEQKDSLR
jgi:hypothetical protein